MVIDFDSERSIGEVILNPIEKGPTNAEVGQFGDQPRKWNCIKGFRQIEVYDIGRAAIINGKSDVINNFNELCCNRVLLSKAMLAFR